MLSDTERQEIGAAVARSETTKAACVDALLVVQRHRGWVSDEALSDVAEALDMGAAELESIATFYNLIYRKPVGKHVVHVCDGISCWIMGGHDVKEHLLSRLGVKAGETTPDGRITVLPANCMGACDRAPTLIVDQTLHTNITKEKVDELLDELEGGKG